MTAETADDFVHTVSLGEGPALLALGSTHVDHAYLRPWIDDLAASATVIYMDLPGTGRSAMPADPAGLGHETWLAGIDRVVERLSLPEKIVLFGHSYGGFLAQEYALQSPERLSGVVLCSTAPAMDYPETIMTNARELGDDVSFAAAQQALTTPAASDRDLEEMWYRLLPLYFHRYTPEIGQRLTGDCRFTSAAWNRSLECLAAFNTVDGLESLDVPVLALGGRHDWLTPLEHGAGRIASLAPRAEMVVFEESGHFPFVEEHELFVQIVSDWMARLSDQTER